MDELAETLSRLRAAWMAGRAARPHCPAAWLPAVGDGPGAELALAALAGQALQSAFRPAPPVPLTARDPLPALALPTVAEALRPRLRRILSAYPALTPYLLAFFAARGVTAHPFDWLPGKGADALPAVYAPWVAWAGDGRPPPKPMPKLAPKPDEADAGALAAELAAMLEVKATGLLRRGKRLRIPPLKLAPQKARRLALFAETSFAALAEALRVTPAELVQAAPDGAEADIAAFAAMAAAGASPEERRQLLAAMLGDNECPLDAARPLAATLDGAPVLALLPDILRRETGPTFTQALDLARGALGVATLEQIAAAPGYGALRKHLAAADTERVAKAAAAAGLAALGLLADAQAAASLLRICLAEGLSPADPRLDALQLNAALNPETPA